MRVERLAHRPPSDTTKSQAYANRHGFRFEVVREDGAAAGRDARWSKVQILRRILDEARQGRGLGGAVFWMDSDAVFANFNFSVLDVAQQLADEDKQLAVCKDLSKLKEVSRQTCGPVCLNTGTLLLLDTDWTRSLMQSWWTAAEKDFPSFLRGGDHEESVLAELYAADVMVGGPMAGMHAVCVCMCGRESRIRGYNR